MHRTHERSASKAWLLPALLVTAAVLAGQGLAVAATLEDSIRAAIATNPDIGIVREDRRAVDQELRQARALRLPQVDARAAAGPEWTNSPSTRTRATRPLGGDASTTLLRLESQLTLTQMLFDGFATQSEIERQTARVDSAAYRVQEAAEFIALNAVEQHLDILRNEDLVDLAADNIAQHEGIFGQVGELERAGRVGISDVHQAESRLANAQQVLATVQGNLLDALASYQRVVGQRAEDLLIPRAPVQALPEHADAAAAIASVRSPTVLISAADVDVTGAELRGSRAGFYPRLDVEAGVGANRQIEGVRGSNTGAQALLVLRYNLFRGGADIAREREAFARMNEARQVLHRARVDAEEEARLSYNALTTARARSAALRAQVEAQRRTRDAYLSQFEIGQRTLLDVLDAENELFVTRSALVTAEYTELFAVYRVLAVAGIMLETLDIEHPPETITIWRRSEDLQTPERVEEKTGPIRHPFEEPRPFRPTVDPESEGGSMAPGAALDEGEPQPVTTAAEPAASSGRTLTRTASTSPVEPVEYESFQSFIGSLFGRERPEAEPGAEAQAGAQEHPESAIIGGLRRLFAGGSQ